MRSELKRAGIQAIAPIVTASFSALTTISIWEALSSGNIGKEMNWRAASLGDRKRTYLVVQGC